MSLSFLFNAPIPVKIVTPDGNVDDALGVSLSSFITWDQSDKGIITLDASISESHRFSSEVTDHDVEEGFVISDHVRRRPRTLTIEGSITDAPVQYLSALTTGDLGAGLGGIANFSGQLSRSQKAYEKLRQLWYDGEPFTVITGKDMYKNVVFVNLDMPADAMIGRRCRFSASLKQLRIVDTDPAATAANDVASILSDLGYLAKQVPDAVTIAGALVFLGLIATNEIAGPGVFG